MPGLKISLLHLIRQHVSIGVECETYLSLFLHGDDAADDGCHGDGCHGDGVCHDDDGGCPGDRHVDDGHYGDGDHHGDGGCQGDRTWGQSGDLKGAGYHLVPLPDKKIEIKFTIRN